MISRLSWLAFLIAILVTILSFKGCSLFASPNNGFELDNAVIPPAEILPGGPRKDGIPSIDKPKFESINQVNWLSDDDLVLSLSIDGINRAYPIAILNWHEIVNDQLGDHSVVISYCPLCGTGMAFDARVKNKTLEFGVSGLLYNSDVLLYDRETESLWSQIMQQSVSGPMVGEGLELLPMSQLRWSDWKQRYPSGEVLSRNTGYHRDYSLSPYGDYNTSPVIYFPVEFLSKRYHPKEQVIGIEVEGKFKAYPFAELAKAGEKEIHDSFNGRNFVIRYNVDSRTGEIFNADQMKVKPSVIAFWFAWFTFHPDTLVYSAK